MFLGEAHFSKEIVKTKVWAAVFPSAQENPGSQWKRRQTHETVDRRSEKAGKEILCRLSSTL